MIFLSSCSCSSFFPDFLSLLCSFHKCWPPVFFTGLSAACHMHLFSWTYGTICISKHLMLFYAPESLLMIFALHGRPHFFLPPIPTPVPLLSLVNPSSRVSTQLSCDLIHPITCPHTTRSYPSFFLLLKHLLH